MDSHAHIDTVAAANLKDCLARTEIRALAAVDRLDTTPLSQRWRDEQFVRFKDRLQKTKRSLEAFQEYSRELRTQIDRDLVNAAAIRRLG